MTADGVSVSLLLPLAERARNVTPISIACTAPTYVTKNEIHLAGHISMQIRDEFSGRCNILIRRAGVGICPPAYYLV